MSSLSVLAIRVLKGSCPESDPRQAMDAGLAATAEPQQKIFRFNPGAQKTIFPPKHPYFKVPEKVREIVKKAAAMAQEDNGAIPLGDKEIKTADGLKKAIAKIGDEWFVNGKFHSLVKETGKHNAETDFQGKIWLKEDIRDCCISGFEKLRNGKECTRAEEKAICTLWHEITHNRHNLSKDSSYSLTDYQRQYMETANEFVARKTLPELYKKTGGHMHYPEFMSDRSNCGYNRWVVNYQNVIRDYRLDEATVLKSVMEGLFEGDLTKQQENLANALFEGGKYTDENGKAAYRITKEQADYIVLYEIL